MKYDLSKTEAEYLTAVLEGKERLLEAPCDLLDLLRKTLQVADTFEENAKEFLFSAGLGWDNPDLYFIDKLNLPSLRGALECAQVLPRVKQKKSMCNDCAFRIGSPANQTTQVAEEAIDALEGDACFHCHDIKSDRPRSRECQGFAQIIKIKGGES